MRILALDVGERRIGVAVSDPLGMTAQGLTTYTRRGMERDLAYFAGLCREWQAQRLVLGLPLHMNGDAGDSAAHVRELAGQLEAACGIPVEFVDERLTTVAAHRILSEGNVRGGRRKQTVDTVAAVLILETYLGLLRNRKETP